MDPAVLRIVDANCNRAREALRALEEYARFALNDRGLSERVKQCRHDLAAAAAALPAGAVLSARDTERDVGTEVSTASEAARADASAVAAAAAKRAGEALRCLEEYGKTIDAAAAARFEALRYRVYALEQDAMLGGPLRARLRAARLHVLVTEALCAGPWAAVCEQALAGGADVLQLREKSLGDRELLDRARRLRALTRERGALLIVNDRPDIARLAEADGVHVGQDDLPVAEARRILGPAGLIGKSTHDVPQAKVALAERPDYMAVGPMFASRTKPGGAVAGPGLLAAVAREAEVPVVAIGGVTAENVDVLGEAITDALGSGHGGERLGAFAVAVCQAVIGADDPAGAARVIRGRIGRR